MAKRDDKYVNMAFASVAESAANTLTFSEIQTGASLFDKVAWNIHRILWYPGSGVLRELDAETDRLIVALTVSNKVAALSLEDPAVIDQLTLTAHLMGAGVSSILHHLPFISDFSTLPGQGLIVPPKPVFIAIQGAGLAAEGDVSARIYFTHVDLSTEDYWELVEARRMIE